MRTLIVAAGGGGDAIAAAMVAAGEAPCVATFSWDRVIYDPVPGPRGVTDFTGLRTPAADCHEIVGATTARPPARSTIPRLAAELPARFFLLDPLHGAPGLARQLRAVARQVGAGRVTLVDVGGDLVARGDESGLRSPLADALALTACELSGLPFDAQVCGPGLDGELVEEQVLDRCARLGGTRLADLDAERVAGFRPIFRWHPSEVTGLFAAAVRGVRGTVEIRDAGDLVPLTDRSPARYRVPAEALVDDNLFVEPLRAAASLDEAQRVVAAISGRDELARERVKAAERRVGVPGDLRAAVESEVRAARDREADFLSVRRMAELLLNRGFAAAEVEALKESSAVDPPLWLVR
ncbi:DUF1152 domain-containing protein [Actinokineospora auranticolor]|uniref:DUF1152 domain-containing protein n=1 Tax=Actinokineospora auranticolor TaxID=155976 RepID=A0A2S6GX94_9PSEU|nr:DUF1152 domain-containing protein [Actinokineospora auranticolor]PPK69790.1 hypothetical protein CLV40_103400 [Actinokineospora auranticolor]